MTTSLIYLVGGLRPANPPYTLARGGPCPAPLAWLTRSARSLLKSGGFAANPPYTLARGGPCPAPLAWLTRSARSLLTSGGLRPADAPYTLAHGGPCPAPLAWLTRPARSLLTPRGLRPADALQGSRAMLVRFFYRPLRPPPGRPGCWRSGLLVALPPGRGVVSVPVMTFVTTSVPG